MMQKYTKCISPTLLIALLTVVGVMASQRTPLPIQKGDTLNSAERLVTSTQYLRIGTYNIHQGEDIFGNDSIGELTQILKQADLDVVALNEVGGNLLGTENQAEELADLLDMGWLFSPARKKDFVANFGNALLSRIEIHDYSIEPLIWQRTVDNFVHRSNANRNMIVSKFMFMGQEVTLIATHLDRGPLRTEQLEDVLNLTAMIIIVTAVLVYG